MEDRLLTNLPIIPLDAIQQISIIIPHYQSANQTFHIANPLNNNKVKIQSYKSLQHLTKNQPQNYYIPPQPIPPQQISIIIPHYQSAHQTFHIANLLNNNKVKIQTPENLAKIDNALIEAFVAKNNIFALKILFYIAKMKIEIDIKNSHSILAGQDY